MDSLTRLRLTLHYLRKKPFWSFWSLFPCILVKFSALMFIYETLVASAWPLAVTQTVIQQRWRVIFRNNSRPCIKGENARLASSRLSSFHDEKNSNTRSAIVKQLTRPYLGPLGSCWLWHTALIARKTEFVKFSSLRSLTRFTTVRESNI